MYDTATCMIKIASWIFYKGRKLNKLLQNNITSVNVCYRIEQKHLDTAELFYYTNTLL